MRVKIRYVNVEIARLIKAIIDNEKLELNNQIMAPTIKPNNKLAHILSTHNAKPCALIGNSLPDSMSRIEFLVVGRNT